LLAGQPAGRFKFTFTPEHGSWLNLVEGFFSKLARSVLRHIRVSSKQELKDRVMAAMDFFNRDPVVHTWTCPTLLRWHPKLVVINHIADFVARGSWGWLQRGQHLRALEPRLPSLGLNDKRDPLTIVIDGYEGAAQRIDRRPLVYCLTRAEISCGQNASTRPDA
jgi:hypothetical protein